MKKLIFIVTVLVTLLNVQNVHANEFKTSGSQNLWNERLEFEYNMTISENNDNWIEHGDGTAYYIPNDYKMIFVNGELLKNTREYIENENMFVPIRKISETLGYNVEWNEEFGEAYLINDSMKIIVRPNESTIIANNLTINLEEKPYIVDDTMYVPLSFFSQDMNTVFSYYDGNFEDSQNSLVQWREAIYIDNVVDENKILTKNEALEHIKIACLNGLDNFKITTTEKLIKETGEDRFKDEYVHIENAINNIEFLGETERYYIYDMSVYRILYDKVTEKFYFNYTLSLYEFTVEFDENSTELYWHRFLVD